MAVSNQKRILPSLFGNIQCRQDDSTKHDCEMISGLLLLLVKHINLLGCMLVLLEMAMLIQIPHMCFSVSKVILPSLLGIPYMKQK